MSRSTRFVVSLLFGFALAIAIVTTLGRWFVLLMQSQSCSTTVPSDLVCRGAVIVLFGLYTGLWVVVVPLLAVFITWLALRLLTVQPLGISRPTGHTLGTILLGWYAISGLAGGAFVYAAFPSGSMPMTGPTLVASFGLSLLAGASALLLWQVRVAGRGLALAYLFVSVALTLFSLSSSKVSVAWHLASVGVGLLTQVPLLVYLLSPAARLVPLGAGSSDA